MVEKLVRICTRVVEQVKDRPEIVQYATVVCVRFLYDQRERFDGQLLLVVLR